jgi:hypothetical protein
MQPVPSLSSVVISKPQTNPEVAGGGGGVTGKRKVDRDELCGLKALQMAS